MRTRLGEPLTLKQIAAELDRQPEYLGWLFQHETGCAFHRRLTTRRLRRAAHLIRHGVKIDAVVLMVGYRGKKNFYEQFRRAFGMTPGAYRDRVRRGEAVPRLGRQAKEPEPSDSWSSHEAPRSDG